MSNFIKCFGNINKETCHIKNRLLSNAICLACVIDSNWAINECLGIKKLLIGVKRFITFYDYNFSLGLGLFFTRATFFFSNFLKSSLISLIIKQLFQKYNN